MALTQIFYWVMFAIDRFGDRVTIVPCHVLTGRYSAVMVICALATFIIVYTSKRFYSSFICNMAKASLAI